MTNFHLSMSQIRLAGYKIAEMESMRRSVALANYLAKSTQRMMSSCFISAGDMVYDPNRVNELARDCYL